MGCRTYLVVRDLREEGVGVFEAGARSRRVEESNVDAWAVLAALEPPA